MKKRVLAIVAAIMVMMMGTLTVSAAGSPSTAYDSPHYAAPTVSASTTVTVDQAKMVDLTVASKAVSGTELWSADITAPAGTAVTVTAPVTGVTEGESDLVVVHVLADKSVEYLKYTAGNGTVTFTMTSYSPVFIYRGAAMTAADTTTSAAVSAKTGEAMAVVLFAAIALAGVAAVCAKKARA